MPFFEFEFRNKNNKEEIESVFAESDVAAWEDFRYGKKNLSDYEISRISYQGTLHFDKDSKYRKPFTGADIIRAFASL
jgi:hypothetical protein